MRTNEKGNYFLTDKHRNQAQCTIAHNCSEFGFVKCYFYNWYEQCQTYMQKNCKDEIAKSLSIFNNSSASQEVAFNRFHTPGIKLRNGLERFLHKYGEDYLINIRRRLIKNV